VRALWILIVVLVAGALTLAMVPRVETEPVVVGTPITIPRRAGGSASTAALPHALPTTAASVPPPPPSSAATGKPPQGTSAKPQAGGASAAASAVPASLGGLAELGMDRTIPTATVARGELVRRPDGSILADGKWPISGDGSAERPYEITWDLLLSAKETYQPRLGEFVIPQRVALLDGAHVRISGYVAFPIVASEADECLLMLNQWDGCCIGVPPSPYDGIEAKLVRSQDNSRKHLFLYGTLAGVFHVDPFVQGKWLVGLYTMTDADLVTDL
jgi:hypothetical protein